MLTENVATPEGKLLGNEVARLCDQQLAGKPDHRCATCAFRAGDHPANGSPDTLMNAVKCVAERNVFWCHETESSHPTRACAGWAACVVAETEKMEMPWDYTVPPPSEMIEEHMAKNTQVETITLTWFQVEQIIRQYYVQRGKIPNSISPKIQCTAEMPEVFEEESSVFEKLFGESDFIKAKKIEFEKWQAEFRAKYPGVPVPQHSGSSKSSGTAKPKVTVTSLKVQVTMPVGSAAE